MGNQQQSLQRTIMLEGLNIKDLPLPKDLNKRNLDMKELIMDMNIKAESVLLAEYCITRSYLYRLLKDLKSKYLNLPIPFGFVEVPLKSPYRYAVSIDGLVLSVMNRKILKPIPRTKGYLQAAVTKYSEDGLGRKIKNYPIHRLVAMTYLPNPDNLPQVNHIDGNKCNNCVDNLEWCSNEYNMAHSYTSGLREGTQARGEHNFNSKLTGEKVKDILHNYQIKSNKVSDYTFCNQYAKQYNVTRPAILAVIKRQTWKYVSL